MDISLEKNFSHLLDPINSLYKFGLDSYEYPICIGRMTDIRLYMHMCCIHMKKLFNLIVFERKDKNRTTRKMRTVWYERGRVSGNQMFADKSSSFSTRKINKRPSFEPNAPSEDKNCSARVVLRSWSEESLPFSSE